MKSLMKNPLNLILLIFVVCSQTLMSQTAGTFTFSLATTSTGGYSPKHLVAIWIEDNSGNFVKTKAKYSSDSNLDHLAVWTGKSNLNTVDATTGATLTSHGTLTVVWNGTDVNGNLVPDGTYKVWIEMAWASSLTTGKTYTSFNFTKGNAAFHSNPADLANFTSISVDWAPSATSVNSISPDPIQVYPNPTSRWLTFNLKSPVTSGKLEIISVDGKALYQEAIRNSTTTKTLDLEKLPSGIYFLSITEGTKTVNYRFIKNKE